MERVRAGEIKLEPEKENKRERERGSEGGIREREKQMLFFLFIPSRSPFS